MLNERGNVYVDAPGLDETSDGGLAGILASHEDEVYHDVMMMT